jgi:hypothetical protein
VHDELITSELLRVKDPSQVRKWSAIMLCTASVPLETIKSQMQISKRTTAKYWPTPSPADTHNLLPMRKSLSERGPPPISSCVFNHSPVAGKAEISIKIIILMFFRQENKIL